MRVHDLLDRAAAVAPTASGIVSAGERLSYARLSELSHACAAWLLEQGVTAGDRVLLQAWNSAAVTAFVFGCSRVGAVLVPVSAEMRAFQLRQVFDDAAPKLVLADTSCYAGMTQAGIYDVGVVESVWEHLVQRRGGAVVRPVDDEALAWLIYTSGSTAAPKGVMCPHRQVVFVTEAIASRLGYQPEDVVFVRLPLSFDYGLYQLLLATLAGATLYLANQRRAVSVLRELIDSEATVVPLVPSLAAMLNELAARRGTGGRVRLFTNTGARLAPTTIAELRRNFPGAAIVLMYGITECKRVSIGDPDGDLVDPLSLGPPLPGTEAYIVDDAGNRVGRGARGQIVVKGPHVMSGYWRARDLTRQRFGRDAGVPVLFTGDYGRLSDCGHIYFEGRQDDVLKRRGVRVSVLEVEAALLDVPGVRAAAVVPADRDGDELVGFVVGEVDTDGLARELAERLEVAKRPDRLVALEHLPLGANGKTDRSALGALARALSGKERSRHD